MKKILFTCFGNICRSPMAESVFTHLAHQAGKGDRFVVDSAATDPGNIGRDVYQETKRVLHEHDIPVVCHRARVVTKADYDTFDHIIGMDEMNRRDILRITGGDPQGKISLLLDWTDEGGEIADPWYTRDFERTLSEVLTGSNALFKKLDE